ncbi:MAG TPA: hypothetical protein VNS62_07835 [Candidatus Udaeobacter sp.]|nr:hypothetical protein [Candidatus Udaeobacter sp.]
MLVSFNSIQLHEIKAAKEAATTAGLSVHRASGIASACGSGTASAVVSQGEAINQAQTKSQPDRNTAQALLETAKKQVV